MSHVARAARACWRFVAGDDWRLALAVAAAIGLVGVLAGLSLNPWWVLPVAVPLLLWLSVSAAARRSGRQ